MHSALERRMCCQCPVVASVPSVASLQESWNQHYFDLNVVGIEGSTLCSHAMPARPLAFMQQQFIKYIATCGEWLLPIKMVPPDSEPPKPCWKPPPITGPRPPRLAKMVCRKIWGGSSSVLERNTSPLDGG